MLDEIWTPVAAGVAAGLGVAMPLGAIAALLLREGLLNGFRVAAAAAAGTATVDLIYCVIATLTGATFARVIDGHRGTFVLASGVVIIAIGIVQLRQGHEQSARRAGDVERVTARIAFGRFAGLTAVNPITLVYFVALSGAVTTAGGSWVGPVVFAATVGASSLAWQLLLAGVGSYVGASVSPNAVRAIGVIASLLIVGLGAVVLINGAAALA